MAAKKVGASAPAPTYDPDATYEVTFKQGIKHPDNERLRFVPGNEYEMRGDILEGVKDAVAEATKKAE